MRRSSYNLNTSKTMRYWSARKAVRKDKNSMVERITKKFLTVCEGGNVRSVSMAFTLKHYFRQDAIAFSHAVNSDEILKILADWADYIIVMQPKFADRFGAWKPKLRVVDVGPDRWGNPLHDELHKFLAKVAQDWANRNFEI